MKDRIDGSARFMQMTEAPISRLIPRLAVPTIISMLVTGAYNIADTFFVSKLGTSATGAVGIVFSLMTLIQTVGFTFGVGAGSYISRLLGQRDPEQANRALSTAFFTALACGLAILAGGLSCIDALMRTLGATQTILPFAREYARYILMGAPVMAASFVMNVALRSEGSAFLSMLGIGAGAVLISRWIRCSYSGWIWDPRRSRRHGYQPDGELRHPAVALPAGALCAAAEDPLLHGALGHVPGNP